MHFATSVRTWRVARPYSVQHTEIVALCRVLGREPKCRERREVSESQAGSGGDEGAEVAEGSRDIRVEAGECPERT
jgi:hypothetical protein